MKYSTILIGAFAATAMARAVPAELKKEYDPQVQEYEKIKTLNDKKGGDYDDKSKGGDHDKDKSKDKGGDYDKDKGKGGDYDKDKGKGGDYDKDKGKGGDYDKDKGKGGDYDKDKDHKKDDKGYDKDGKKDHKDHKDNDKYKPVERCSYEERKERDGKDFKTYSPEPKEYDDKKSCYTGLGWSKNVKADEPCKIKWDVKKDKKDRKKKNAHIKVYRCDDYSKEYETVCDSCGDGEYEWKPKRDCQPSDAPKGCMYRYQFCDKDSGDCTWSEEFAIYNKVWYEDKPDQKPVPEQCPPEEPEEPECPEPAPAYPAAPAKEEAYPAAPAAPAAPAEAAPAAPAEAPAAEAAPAAAPAAEAAPAEAATPAYQPPTALVAGGNQTDLVLTAGASAVQYSVSMIGGLAVLVALTL